MMLLPMGMLIASMARWLRRWRSASVVAMTRSAKCAGLFRHPGAQPATCFGEEIHRQQVVIGPRGAHAFATPLPGRKIDGRMHVEGGGLILYMHPIGAQFCR
jgi:hypothetical protein